MATLQFSMGDSSVNGEPKPSPYAAISAYPPHERLPPSRLPAAAHAGASQRGARAGAGLLPCRARGAPRLLLRRHRFDTRSHFIERWFAGMFSLRPCRAGGALRLLLRTSGPVWRDLVMKCDAH